MYHGYFAVLKLEVSKGQQNLKKIFEMIARLSLKLRLIFPNSTYRVKALKNV